MFAMQLVFLIIVPLVIFLVQCEEGPKTREELEIEEDHRFLKESIAKFGPPQSARLYGLLGPEIKVDAQKLVMEDEFNKEDDNVTYRYRSTTDHFSYNRYYEKVKTIIKGAEKSTVVSGQVSKHIPRTYGGFYVRTFGYLINGDGCDSFLIDVSIVKTRKICFLNGMEVRCYGLN